MGYFSPSPGEIIEIAQGWQAWLPRVPAQCPWASLLQWGGRNILFKGALPALEVARGSTS